VGEVRVTMPRLGQSMEEGMILKWEVAIGSVVQEGDLLCEISTDKVEQEYYSPAAGVVVELLVPEGGTVGVGSQIATMRNSGEGDVVV